MTPDIAAAIAAAISEIATRPRLLVATDFDGVLAPFVLDPLDARPQPGTIESLTRLAAAEATWTAIVSGRDLATLGELSGLAGSETTLVGSHGAESSRTGRTTDVEASARLETLRAYVEPNIATRDPRIRLEHKPTALVLHTRGLPEDAVGVADHLAQEASRISGVSLLTGKGVHELSVVHADKGTALLGLAEELGVDGTVYLGDDVTDEHVFTALGSDDLTIKVGPGDTAARFRVADCGEVPAVLAALSDVRTG